MGAELTEKHNSFEVISFEKFPSHTSLNVGDEANFTESTNNQCTINSAEPTNSAQANTSNETFHIIIEEKMNKIRAWFSEIPKKMGSWGQFCDHKQFSFPSSISDVSKRCPDNIQVFFANYLIICILLLTYCLLTSPLLLLGLTVFLILLYTIIHRDQDLMLFGQSITRNQQLIALGIGAIPFFFLLGLTNVFFWLIGASTCFIGLHSIFHESPKLSAEEVSQSPVSNTNNLEMDISSDHKNGTNEPNFHVVTF